MLRALLKRLGLRFLPVEYRDLDAQRAAVNEAISEHRAWSRTR